MNMKFSTTLLDIAIERKKKELEKIRLQLLKKLINTLDKLGRELPFEEAYIFGSIAKPFRFVEGSDIDIGFIGLKDDYFFKAISYISSEMGMDVDVIQMEGHRLADKIRSEGIRWTKKD